MGLIALGFCAASVLTFGLTAPLWLRDPETYGLRLASAGMLFLTWAVSNTLTLAVDPPAGWVGYPIMDAVCGALVILIWLSRRSTWAMVLSCLFILECILHVAFWLQGHASYGLLYTYALALNIIFAAQLLTVGWAGGAHVVAWLVDLLSGPDRRRRAVPIRPGSG